MLVDALISRRDDLELIKASTGSQCLRMAANSPPDVLVIELMLADMKGIDLLVALSQTESTSVIPIIALTVDAFARHIDVAMNAGLFRYVTKPFKLPDLMQAIDDALKIKSPVAEIFASHHKGHATSFASPL
jgi:CheY-like chemotaxis protein